MSLSRIKTILIILFLLTDIFLGASILTSQKKETEISPEVLESSMQILKSHNIDLNQSAVLPKISSAPVLQADNVVYDYASFAKMLLGNSFKVEATSTYFSDMGKVSFLGDRFIFNSAKKYASSEHLPQKTAQKRVFSFLKGIGFNMTYAEVVSVTSEDGIWYMKICDFAEKHPVFSSQIDVAVSKNGILSLSGSWFNRKDVHEQDSSLKSITAILIDFAMQYQSDIPAEITSAELGYSVFDSENYHKSASLIPVTKIVLNGNDEYFMDARAIEQ